MSGPYIKIVVSYRRDDAPATAGRIFDRLAQRYGRENVFMDIDSIPIGVDFYDYIQEILNGCNALVAIIGPRWIGQRKGKPSRIKEETDFVRMEVEAALQRNISVAPVLVDGALLPRRDQLPEPLQALIRRNAAAVDSGRDFHAHVDRLIRDLDRLLPTTTDAISAALKEDIVDQQSEIAGGGKASGELSLGQEDDLGGALNGPNNSFGPSDAINPNNAAVEDVIPQPQLASKPVEPAVSASTVQDIPKLCSTVLGEDVTKVTPRSAFSGSSVLPRTRWGTTGDATRAIGHPNPLVKAFAPLLEFAPELESSVAPENPEALRMRLFNELVMARDTAMAGGASLARADASAWAVAALLDDLALNTTWGGASAWPRQPLVVMLRGDVDASAQLFARLEELERDSTRDPELLELLYYCLALGFRGKYRVPGRSGDRSLNAVRVGAARFLHDADAEDAPLSPNWKCVVASDEPARLTIPIWVMALGALALAAAIHVVLAIGLSSRAVELSALVRALPPPDRAQIQRASPKVDAPDLETVDFALLPEFEAAAPTELRTTLKGTESISLATLVIQGTNPELFQSSQAQLTEGFEPLIGSIAKVILENQDLIGNITVVGHTDSSDSLSTNQRLSEARAATIAQILIQNGVPEDRVRSEGRAATDPVADDSTREGRALNRRVEVLVEKRL